MSEKSICRNPWCKSTFIYTESDMVLIDGVKSPPMCCKKCESFSKELSAGVEWKDKEYDDIIDDFPHQIKYKITKYR